MLHEAFCLCYFIKAIEEEEEKNLLTNYLIMGGALKTNFSCSIIVTLQNLVTESHLFKAFHRNQSLKTTKETFDYLAKDFNMISLTLAQKYFIWKSNPFHTTPPQRYVVRFPISNKEKLSDAFAAAKASSASVSHTILASAIVYSNSQVLLEWGTLEQEQTCRADCRDCVETYRSYTANSYIFGRLKAIRVSCF